MRSSNYPNEESLESTYSFSLFLSSTWIIKFGLHLLLHKRCSENRYLFSEPQKYGINCFSFSVERQPVLSMAASPPSPPHPRALCRVCCTWPLDSHSRVDMDVGKTQTSLCWVVIHEPQYCPTGSDLSVFVENMGLVERWKWKCVPRGYWLRNSSGMYLYIYICPLYFYLSRICHIESSKYVFY